MTETINIEQLWQILKKNLLMILSLAAVFAIGSALITYFLITPKYQASTQILVNQKEQQGQIQVQEVQTNLQLINTYNEIIKTPAILDKVIDNLKLEGESADLASKVNVTNQQQSQVINVTVTDVEQAEAVKIVNEISKVFQDEIENIMNVDNVSILTKAEKSENPTPVSPKPLVNIAIAFILGALLGLAIAFLREFLDKSVKNEEDVAQHIGLPVLGSIPAFKQK
ncbi:YveK family protein [Abyssicoccus albus]|uniref:Capsular polysaccharide biosynthesis protein n=1 Tax=Abyssicoccus albus TaxID=1817405 RepID=A0A3N5CKC5_9BACL|nr:Wzz/FepE/Etk N-terminal domain-containing protein [Abyssicoccus albus]RPF58301.1 capsular polysaccharide biosynthesis protein [Abyssicoccus albus]